MKEKNIGGYDINYKYDRIAINYLEQVLLESELIMPHFESGDKIPNLDGYLELCEEAQKKINPIGRFDVQIKSLNHDYINNNVNDKIKHSYKYSCDTKVINVVLGLITINPVLLILVDSKNKHIFWKYMSESYCLELDAGTQKNKTIYFDDADEIIDPNQWYDLLREIHKNVVYERLHGSENIVLLSDKKLKVPTNIQNMSDYLNSILDNELWFIKQAFFQDTWKIGIAYINDNKDSFSCVGLYKIKKNENDLFIKQFKENEEYFCSIHYGNYYDIEDIIKQTLTKWIYDFFEKDNYTFSLFPDVILNELLFEYIDSAIIMSEANKNATKLSFGWHGINMSMEELNVFINNNTSKHEQLFLRIKQELETRNVNSIHRPWEKIMDYDISKSEEYYSSEQERINRNNMKLFLNQFEKFFISNKEKFGSRSEKVFKIKKAYILVVNDNVEGYIYGIKESETFSLEIYTESENKKLYDELRQSAIHSSKKYINSGWGRLILGDCSWHKLWRVFNRNLFLKYIGVEEHRSIMFDYIASK